MKEILKLGAILGAITAVCVGSLGYVNSLTTPVIDKQKEESKKIAMQEIIPEADEFVVIEVPEEAGIDELFAAQAQGEYIGVVAKVLPEGYGGAIEVLVGISATQEIEGIQILSHTETPGLGANMTNPSFIDQFKQAKSPLSVTKGVAADSEISAITGATITSTAVTEGVNRVAEYVAANSETWAKEAK